MRSRLMIRYVLGEMIPTFFLGVIVFVLILLMFQALRLTEFVLIHGVKLSTVATMMGYMSTSFLPVLFPMSLLFAVLLTYGRLSSDSEIVAFRAIGLSMTSIIAPAVIMGTLVGVLSLQTSFHLAPWGNRQFEVLFRNLAEMKPAATIKEGTFSEGFFDLVVYANKVDSKTSQLKQIFIFDERKSDTPITVIAQEGQIIHDPDKPGHRAALQLRDGSIHRIANGRHTKIDFSTYDLFFSDPINQAVGEKTPPSLTIDDLREELAKNDLPDEQRRILETEKHKRVAISIACVLFALIGVGLGTVNNRRSGKSGGMVICLGLIVVYWIIHVASEGAARKGQLPPHIAMWLANGVFTIAAMWSLRRSR